MCFPSTSPPFHRYVPTRSLHQHHISRIYLHRVVCLLFVPHQERAYFPLCKNRAEDMNITKSKRFARTSTIPRAPSDQGRIIAVPGRQGWLERSDRGRNPPPEVTRPKCGHKPQRVDGSEKGGVSNRSSTQKVICGVA